MKPLLTAPIGHVVGVGFGLIFALTLLVALGGRIAYNINKQQDEVIQARSEVERLTLALEILAIRRTDALRRYLASDPALAPNSHLLEAYQNHKAAYDTAYPQIAALLNTPEEAQTLAAVAQAEAAFDNKAQEMLRLYASNFPSSARFLWESEGLAARDEFLQAVERLRQLQGDTSTQIISRAHQTEETAIYAVNLFILLVFVVGVVAGFAITRTISRPVSDLVRTTSKLGFDLTARVQPSGPREIAYLGHSINEMAAQLAGSEQALQAHKDRLERELHLASQIQASLLPAAPPQSPYLDTAVLWQPAREMGGDFYTYINLAPGKWGIALGDVSGKGAPAALAGALAAGLLESYAPAYDRPEALLSELNRELCARFKANQMNVGCCYVILDLNLARLTVANAGGMYPYLRRNNTFMELDVFGLPLGTCAEFGYTAQSHPLSPGDILILSSDGLIEMHNPQGHLFGFERFEAELLSLPLNANAQAVVDHLTGAVRKFAEGAELHDDLTILALRFKGLQ
jgi:serine phosphatase RsbU (regulator of sigma subunit)/CHASE3 domain sensor protein